MFFSWHPFQGCFLPYHQFGINRSSQASIRSDGCVTWNRYKSFLGLIAAAIPRIGIWVQLSPDPTYLYQFCASGDALLKAYEQSLLAGMTLLLDR